MFDMTFFPNFLRPRITTVQVVVYSDGKELDMSSYPELYHLMICRCVDELWTVPEGSTFWFETELVEACGCFTRSPPTIYVTCYKDNINSRNFKTAMGIPIRYRSKMFDKLHTIRPEKAGVKPWGTLMQVRFIIPR